MAVLKSSMVAPPRFVKVIISVPDPETSILGTLPVMTRISNGASGIGGEMEMITSCTQSSENNRISLSAIGTPSGVKHVKYVVELSLLQSKSNINSQGAGMVYSYIDENASKFS